MNIFSEAKASYSPENIDLIKDAYPRFYNPYGIISSHVMQNLTIIEQNVWADLRLLGLPFYPQYPIGKYFVDFADIVAKVIIEVDGFQYHSSIEQIEKDNEREIYIKKLGWDIIRIKGRDTFDESTVIEILSSIEG